jgi:hypothetical protein
MAPLHRASYASMMRLAALLALGGACSCTCDAPPRPLAPPPSQPAVTVGREDVVIEHVPVREVDPVVADVGLAEHLAWQPPLTGVVSSAFGWRDLDASFHDAIDVAAPIGTEVVAPVDLRVRTIAYQARAGRYVIADVVNEEGAVEWRLTFAHLSHVAVFEGDVVKRGRKLGLIGLSGTATGAHLHLRVEAVEDGERIAVDPLPLFAEGSFEEAAPAPSSVAVDLLGGEDAPPDDESPPAAVGNGP